MHDAVNVVNLSPPVVTAHSKPAASAAPPADEFSFDAVLKQASVRIRDQKEESPEKTREQDPNVQAAVQAANGKPQALNAVKKPEAGKKGDVEKEKSEKTAQEPKETVVIQPEVLLAQAAVVALPVSEPVATPDETTLQGESDAAKMVIDVTAKTFESETTQAVATNSVPASAAKGAKDEIAFSTPAMPAAEEMSKDLNPAQINVDTSEKQDPRTAGMSEFHRSEVASEKLEAKALEQGRRVDPTPQPVSSMENAPLDKEIDKSKIMVESKVENPPPETPPVAEGVPINASNTTSQVHEPARLAEAPRNEVISQVSTQLGQMVKANQTSFRMQLYPEELGHIDLRIVTTKTGLAVSMVADNVTTQVALKSEMSHLKQTIEQAGIQISNMHIGHQQTSNGQQTFDGQNNEHKPVYHSNLPVGVSNVVNTKIVSLQESTIDFRA